jgi:hypothetical protein
MKEIYEKFEKNNLTSGQYDFSQRWLGQSASYYSATLSQNRDISLKALVNLLRRVQLELQGDLADDKRVMLSETESQLRKKIFI